MKKKLISILFLILLLFMLSACGSTAPAASPTPAPTAAPTPEPPVPSLNSVLPGSNLQQPSSSSAPADEPPAVDEALYKAACDCIDKDVSVLYEAIGEPLDSSYAPGCLGGDDGELYYEGFFVATLRIGEKETVRDVILNAG